MKKTNIIFSFALLLLLLAGSITHAQVVVNGNVYGGCNQGEVSGNTTVDVNDGTVGKKLTLKQRKADNNAQVEKVNQGCVYGGGNGYVITGKNPNGSPIFNSDDPDAGRVTGNTNVTVGGMSGGKPVVRRAVYGGGSIATVGTATVDRTTGLATYTAGGTANVTIKGDALIGPTKDDLTAPTSAELTQAATDFGMESMTASQYIDTAFKYLGCNEGLVFGSSRGVSGGAEKHLSFANITNVTIEGSAQVMNVFGGGENGHVQCSTNVIVRGNAIVGGVPLHCDATTTSYTIPSGAYKDVSVHLKASEGELTEDDFGVGREILRGNVFGGGKGTDYISWFLPAKEKYCYTAGRVYGNTNVSIQENAKVYNNVYGGGTIASVGYFNYETPATPDPDNHTVISVESGGLCTVNISGGIIGSPGSDGKNNGNVFGGGLGKPGRERRLLDPEDPSSGLESLTPLHQVVDEAYVGSTNVTIDGATVMNSVYGGGASGHVQGDTYVLIKESDSAVPTTIGIENTSKGWHGNVYGGGGGTAQYSYTKMVDEEEKTFTHHSLTAGRVYGNTNLTIQGGKIIHNVYGGGALASVGTYLKYNGVEQDYFGGGIATLNITGGAIGTNGNENGMVFGSGRGAIAEPGNFLDSLTYTAYTIINIGSGTVDENTGAASNLGGTAKINGSVYGSGENGHVYLNATVNIFKGTIGCSKDDYARYIADESTYADSLNNIHLRGNVYGAGCGTDTYLKNGVPTYNPLSGYVNGNTEVNIYGGYISRNVYGAGAMASVGAINHKLTESHISDDDEASHSWPYKLVYISIPDKNKNYVATGTSKVNIRGGHIGTVALPTTTGNVFGSARGGVNELGVLDSLAIVRNTEVTINFVPTLGNITDATVDCIIGSVYGSGEDGCVYENTSVTLTNGRIGGSLFGGGSGDGTHKVTLKNPDYDSQVPGSLEYLPQSDENSITAGKVYGNTSVYIYDGKVDHNVYGGGKLASVGKGNYIGYGEMSGVAPIDPYENSGICNVYIYGGTIGNDGKEVNGIYNGFVYGSSKGKVFKSVSNTPRYLYSRDFFLGYCNATNVVIGPDDKSTTPRIFGSVFGGGDDGHVRWNTKVTVNSGEIGVPFPSTDLVNNQDEDILEDDDWVYRGNVYGSGRGVDTYEETVNNAVVNKYCASAGSVTLNTEVDIKGGIIHRNVFGGGSMSSVGPPSGDYVPGTSTCTVNIYGGTIGQPLTSQQFGITGEKFYGGHIFGAGRGVIEDGVPLAAYATVSNTIVNIDKTGATSYLNLTNGNIEGGIIGNVYGGGDNGQVKIDSKVYMQQGTVKGSIYGGGQGDERKKDAGQVLGNSLVEMTQRTGEHSIVERSIYGGGELGSVGTITYADAAYHAEHDDVAVGTPLSCTDETGTTEVKITDGTVGVVSQALMPPPDPLNDDYGYVFAGCRGVGTDKTDADQFAVNNYTSLTVGGNALVTSSVYGGSENGSVLNDTYVHITGTCQIGVGCNNGTPEEKYTETQWSEAIAVVQNNTFDTYVNPFHECSHWLYQAPHAVYDADVTKVKLTDDGPLVDFDIDRFYEDSDDGRTYQNQVCNAKGFYYDNETSSNGGMPVGTDGHTFFGHVFGGGSGYYAPSPGQWRRSAGQVLGNVKIDIDGGHILTNVYGGNERTDVGTYSSDGLTLLSGGECEINMTGGTVGVPRSINDIINHPVTCYIFGGGAGDQRTDFNEWTNVGKTEVNISGGHIFGSVFGGGEDGHVIGNATVNIYDDIEQDDQGDPLPDNEQVHPFIGTQGLSYVDGNIFGGGRGFSGEALTAGVVCGNVEVNISGGTMLGSIYGGGRLASVGTYLAPVTIEDPNNQGNYIDNPLYGKMQPGENHGFINVNISGGTIGTSRPYKFFVGDGEKATYLRHMTYETIVAKNIFYYDAVNDKNVFDKDEEVHNILTHTKSGNVFGGCMGRITLLDGTTVNPVWPDLARCKKTRVTISGGTIRSSVYGGGEIGSVTDSTTVNILGGTIGTKIILDDEAVDYATLKPLLRNYANPEKYHKFDYTDQVLASRDIVPRYHFGSVYGGGYGDMGLTKTVIDVKHTAELTTYNAPNNIPPVEIAGRVYGNTYVNIFGGQVMDCVFGGGDIASVGTAVYDANTKKVVRYLGDEVGDAKSTGNCTVVVANRTTGTGVDAYTTVPCIGETDYTGNNAHVFGGGRGVGIDANEDYKEYCNVRTTSLTVEGGKIWGCTFGGGSDCHVLGNANTFIKPGADIGFRGITEHDGCVFGGGRNINNKNHTAGRVQGNTYVTVTGGRIMCTIFGGGSMARTGVDVDGNIFLESDGTFDSANHGNTVIDVSGEVSTNYNMILGAVEENYYYLVNCDYTIGDIFGGGKGDTRDSVDYFAGLTLNTFINIHGSPRIMGDVYAGGEMACVGWWDKTRTINNGNYLYKTGYTHVEVDETPYIGTEHEFNAANIANPTNWSVVNNVGRLYHTCSGNVYGGGQGFVYPTHRTWVQMGRIRQSYVTIKGGNMLGNIFGGGSRGLVMENTYVNIEGGHIGCDITDVASTVSKSQHYYYGSVFGGGYGNPSLLKDGFNVVNDSTPYIYNGPDDTTWLQHVIPAEYAGRVYGNTNVKITGGKIMDCVFGGGDIASVGYVKKDPSTGLYLQDDPNMRKNGICNVSISGNAVVGPLDGSGHNAYVYGAGRGDEKDENNEYAGAANVNGTQVTINLTNTNIGLPNVTSEVWDSITHGGRIWGSIFGGGADSHVLGDANVNMVSGVVGTKGMTSYDGNIFGGGRNYLNSNHTNGRVQGNIFITMTGGKIQGSIFGGGRLALSGIDKAGHFINGYHGNVTIDVSGDAVIGTGNSHDLLYAEESVGDIFGAGKGDTKNYDDIWAGRVTNSTIHVHDSYTYEDGHDGESDHIIDTHSPIIHGSVFGGGEMASLGWWDDVIKDKNNVITFHTDGTGGTDYGVFYENTGKAEITITGGVSIGTIDELTKYTKPTHEEEDLDDREWETAPFENPGDWTSYANDGTVFHTCTGNVFGGGQGDVNIACPHWVSMGRSYTSEVIIGDDDDDTRDPSIMGCVFGGGEQGSMLGDAHVTVYSGTIGTSVTPSNSNIAKAFIYGDVYGAGFGSYKTKLEADKYSYKEENEHGEIVENEANAYNDSTAARTAPLSSKPSALAGRVYGDTRVDMLGGTVLGSVYGGGSYASVGYETTTTKGNTLVNIGLPDVNDPEDPTLAVGSATIGQAVFGANNFSGSPYGNTAVHIFKTAHTSDNELTRDAVNLTLVTGNNYPTGIRKVADPDDELTLEDINALTTDEMTSLKDDNRFAIKAVYGGGNNASHTPYTTDGSGTTLVHVHYCKENTICDLYGGGNAANTVNNHVIIDGGYFKRIFGGGNGDGVGNPGADVSGTATTEINGGLFHEVYGGSNTKGTVGNIVLDIDEENDCDELIINGFGGNNEGTGGGGTITIGCGTKFYNFYAGANNAVIEGDIDVTIEGGQFQNFYGGNNQGGSINGDVTVNYRSGHIGNLFGGSNIGGAITGKITVNVFFDETIICPDGMNIDYVYGGGNMAEYSPTDETLIANGKLAPEVNIYKGIINYEVYGGGKGGMYNNGIEEVFKDAAVTANPVVNIGRVWDDPKTTNVDEQEYHEVVIGRDPEKPADPARQNEPVSETNPKLGYHSNNGNVFGGGNASPTQGNTKVYILNNSHVFGGVYGGGNNAIVTGNTDVIIGE